MKKIPLFNTMAGRIFLILLVGIVVAATLGAKIADQKRIADLRHLQNLSSAERIASFLRKFDSASPAKRIAMADNGAKYLRLVRTPPPGLPESDLSEIIATHLPENIGVTVTNIPVSLCMRPRNRQDQDDHLMRAWRATVVPTDCWVISAQLSDGANWHFITGPPPLLLNSRRLMDPGFLLVMGLAAAVLTWIVARMVAKPIRALAEAAGQLGPDLDAPQLPDQGPADVRVAIRAFNAMQRRLHRHLHEQTHMISAITHDLQTPMTRLRLRLDEVNDEHLRARLLNDWRAMREMVDEGLELARSTGVREEVAQLDVDSLIQSIVEDAQDMGHKATFDQSAGVDIRCRPQMLRRCVQNLVDNAIKYGGSAHLSTIANSNDLLIEIRDHGPGIADDRLEDVFEPMVRLEESRSRETGGTGLGLTIARILARRNGGEIHLRNASEGGLIATIALEQSACRS